MEDLQAQVISLVVALVGSLLSWLLLSLRKYIASRIENEYVERVLLRLTDAVETGVREVASTTLPAVKEAAKDRKITAAEAATLRELAKQTVWTQLSKIDRRKLENVFEREQLEEKIDQLIEAAVQRLKEG